MRRRDERERRILPTRRVVYRSVSGFGADCATILGRGTLFVNTRRPLPVGTRLGLVLAYGEPAERVRLSGRVAHVAAVGNGLNETPGMLVTIEPPRPELSARLARYADAWHGRDRSHGVGAA